MFCFVLNVVSKKVDFMFIERNKLREIADLMSGWLAPDGFECLDLDWEASSRTLRVFVDHPSGVGFKECGDVSAKLIEIEELDQLIPCEFNLEVSSPGIERPMRTTAHFKIAFDAHASIDVKLTEKVNGRRKGVGLITVLENNAVTLKTAEGDW
ncbi:MAG: hypothetical protein NTV34_17165, partial [Proteobacteria bacterium]|nr:hypothetical protein [Pseudomonadota bacterium]